MDYKEITELIRLIGKTNIADLTIERGDFRIRLRTAEGMPAGAVIASPAPMQMSAPAAAPAPAQVSSTPTPPAAAAAPVEAPSDYHTIKSPMVGTLYRRPSPDKELFVKVGDKVVPGMVLCVIEAMKLFNEIESEVSGTVVKIYPDDASPVEYDQPLFLIDPKG